MAGPSPGEEGWWRCVETTSLGMWEAGLLQGTRMYFGGSVALELCLPFGYVYNILLPGLRLTLKLGEVSIEAGWSSLSQGVTHWEVSCEEFPPFDGVSSWRTAVAQAPCWEAGCDLEERGPPFWPPWERMQVVGSSARQVA